MKSNISKSEVIKKVEDKIFYDAINGNFCPMTFDDVCQIIKDNPHSSDSDKDAPFFFSSDGTISFSISDIAKLVEIEIETIE
jgi:hypothetical protein